MEDDRSYYRRRAGEQLAAAELADSIATAQIHKSLALLMLAKAEDARELEKGRPKAAFMTPPARFAGRQLDG